MNFFKDNIGLYLDYYELTMAQGYFLTGRGNIQANFDYFFRNNPFNSGYTVFAGLQDLLELITNFTYKDSAIDFLHKYGFKSEFLDYLKNFRFSGSIYSVLEGEIVFPYEPLIRVEGNIIETQLLESIILNVINFESLIATKARRLRYSAGKRKLADFGLRRAQGFAALFASRAAIIGGMDNTSNVYSAFAYDLTPTGTQAHSWLVCSAALPPVSSEPEQHPFEPPCAPLRPVRISYHRTGIAASGNVDAWRRSQVSDSAPVPPALRLA